MRNLPRAAFWLIALGLIVMLSINLTSKAAGNARAAL